MSDRVFKVVAGGDSVDVLTDVAGDLAEVRADLRPIAALLSVRISPIAFFVSVPDDNLALPELVAGDYGEGVTVTEVTGTAWKV